MRDQVDIYANVRIEDAATGKILATGRNKVVDVGLELIADMLAGLPYYPTHIGLGTDATAVAGGDTALGAEEYRAPITRRTRLTKSVELQLYVPLADGNGFTYAEAGLFEAGDPDSPPDGPARLVARVLLSPTIIKTSSVQITIIWTITLAAGS
jgi:hypothetical protein